MNWKIVNAGLIASCLALSGCSTGGDKSASSGSSKQVFDSPNLLFADGVEPGDPAECEAANGRCWYVDAQAAGGGDGSFSAPFNSFEAVVGYMEGEDYKPGLLQGGDHLYVRGTFRGPVIHIARGPQAGTPDNPTVIKSWRGTSRAVFDGEHSRSDLITVRALSDAPVRGVLIRNIEVKNAAGRGIFIGENVEKAIVEGVVVHDGIGDGFSGVGGGVSLTMVSQLHDFTVRNSLFINNRVNPEGGENNIGGLSILSEPEAKNGSIVRVFDNTFRAEHIAVRHKHSGNIRMHARGNLITDSEVGFYVRAFESEIESNQLINVGTAFMLVAENQNGNTLARIRGNDVLESEVLLDTGFDGTGFQRRIEFVDNYYSSTLPVDGIIRLGRYASNEFNTGFWNSSGNTFAFDPAASTFLYVEGVPFNGPEAEGVLGDASLDFMMPAPAPESQVQTASDSAAEPGSSDDEAQPVLASASDIEAVERPRSPHPHRRWAEDTAEFFSAGGNFDPADFFSDYMSGTWSWFNR